MKTGLQNSRIYAEMKFLHKVKFCIKLSIIRNEEIRKELQILCWNEKIQDYRNKLYSEWMTIEYIKLYCVIHLENKEIWDV